MEFEWDDGNERHATQHGLTPVILGQIVYRDQFELFVNEGTTGSHKMIGPDQDDVLWTVILLERGNDVWRPIAGWPSDRDEVQSYREERMKHG